MIPSKAVKAIIGRAMGSFSQIKEAMVFAFNMPAIPALGSSTGFDFFLQDRGGLGHDKLLEARNHAARHGCPEPRAHPGPAQRHGGYPPVQCRYRL